MPCKECCHQYTVIADIFQVARYQICILIRNGLKIDPCGTPAVMVLGVEKSF